jgi:hypothetical protein
MLTLLGSLLGFVSSAVPDLLGIWKDGAVRKHDVALLNMRIAAQKQGYAQELEKVNPQANIAEKQALYAHASLSGGSKWTDTLRASVRPVITYAFFLLFAAVKLAVLFKLLSTGVEIADGIIHIWDPETQSLFAAVVSFWFGQRALARLRGSG